MMTKYFKDIENQVKAIYSVAEAAREKGLDPKSFVEIPLASSLAERVTGLLSVKYPQLEDKKIVLRIKELEKEYGLLDHAVALKIAEEVAKEKFCKFVSHLEAIDAGIRIGFAYITVGVVSSPLEGYTHFKLKKTSDNKDYFCVYYSGPVRSAGGTAASFSLLIADYLRESFGYAKYDASEQEVKRAVTEIYDYHERITNLQYLPSEEEIEFLARNLPIQIDGDPSEDKEVSNYKDLERVETNFMRNGFCLVLAESLAQKAIKILNIVYKLRKKGFGLKDWDFLGKFVELQKKKVEKKKESAEATYIQDLVAGRPVLGHPSRQGGFRLRYGRSRFSGLSSMAISPYTMAILDNFIAIGTQLKYEGPGKSSAMTPCDNIDGPIVKLNNNSVIKIDSSDKLRKAKEKGIKEIIHLGDFLVNYGEFFNRGKKLQKPGYCQEWYAAELERKIEQELKEENKESKIEQGKLIEENRERIEEKEAGGKEKLKEKEEEIKEKKEEENKEIEKLVKEIIKNPWTKISFDLALEISKRYNLSLHPDFIFYWSHLNKELFLGLIDWIAHSEIVNNKLSLVYNKTEQERFKQGKRALELIGIEHEVVTENVLINEEDSKALLFNLGIKLEDEIEEKISLSIGKIKQEEVLDIINNLCLIKIKDKAGSYIGARMGRP